MGRRWLEREGGREGGQGQEMGKRRKIREVGGLEEGRWIRERESNGGSRWGNGRKGEGE